MAMQISPKAKLSQLASHTLKGKLHKAEAIWTKITLLSGGFQAHYFHRTKDNYEVRTMILGGVDF